MGRLPLGPIVVPGFATTATVVSKEQQRYFGLASTWQRVHLRQGDPTTGPAPDGRDIVVDVVSTPRAQSLALFPVVTTYPIGTLSSTPDAEVELEHGVSGQVFRAEDSRHDIAYTLLTFSWRLPVDMSITCSYSGAPAQLNQRITLIAVDDHHDGARFPEPGNATLDGIGAAVASVGDAPEGARGVQPATRRKAPRRRGPRAREPAPHPGADARRARDPSEAGRVRASEHCVNACAAVSAAPRGAPTLGRWPSTSRALARWR